MVLIEFDKIIKNKYDNYLKKKYDLENNSEQILNFDEFKLKSLELVLKLSPFYFSGINQNYINLVLYSNKINIIVYCIGDKFDIKNISSILIYHKTISSTVIKYYILLLGTHERFRKYGYGKIILDEFIEFVKKSNKTNKSNKKIKIILKSLESSMQFYMFYGFVNSDLKSNKLFFKYENASELKLNNEKILELNIE